MGRSHSAMESNRQRKKCVGICLVVPLFSSLVDKKRVLFASKIEYTGFTE